MKIAKTILPIAVIGLFLGMALAPVVAEEAEPASEGPKVRVMWIPAKGELVFDEVTVTEQDLKEAEKLGEGLVNWWLETKPLSDLKFDDDEMARLEEFREDIQTLFGCFFPPMIDLLPLLIPTALRPNGFFSLGWGKSIMPFYRWELIFRGIIPLIHPIRVAQWRGYTGYYQFFPGFSYGDKSKTHYICARIFQGLYIDGGSLITERATGGPVIILGRAVNTVILGAR